MAQVVTPPNAAGSYTIRLSRRLVASLTLAAGTACLLAALLVAGGVAVVLLDALGSVPPGGDCVGAELVPMALLAGSAVLGLAGFALTAVAGVLFWRLTVPQPA